MSFLATLAYAMLQALLWLFGALRFLTWLIFRQWYIPRDKLASTLEYDMAIMEVLPGGMRPWYMGRQNARRWLSERKYWSARANA